MGKVMGNGKTKVLTEAEAIAEVMLKSGLTGGIAKTAIGLAFVYGERAGYHQAWEDSGKAFDKAFDKALANVRGSK